MFSGSSIFFNFAIHFFFYNFIRVHQSLRVTPAMEAKLTDHIWTWENLFNYKELKQPPTERKRLMSNVLKIIHTAP
jgi:hypothetical protein